MTDDAWFIFKRAHADTHTRMHAYTDTQVDTECVGGNQIHKFTVISRTVLFWRSLVGGCAAVLLRARRRESESGRGWDDVAICSYLPFLSPYPHADFSPSLTEENNVMWKRKAHSLSSNPLESPPPPPLILLLLNIISSSFRLSNPPFPKKKKKSQTKTATPSVKDLNSYFPTQILYTFTLGSGSIRRSSFSPVFHIMYNSSVRYVPLGWGAILKKEKKKRKNHSPRKWQILTFSNVRNKPGRTFYSKR